MIPVVLQQPKRLFFGAGSVSKTLEEWKAAELNRILVVTSAGLEALVDRVVAPWRQSGIVVEVFSKIDREPDIRLFAEVLKVARSFEPDGVVGFGGGSPIDVAKLLAALWNKEQTPSDVFGIGLLKGRSTYLACIPTTAGTGADVSPNSILLDESDLLKKGVVSPYLVADASFVDPELTLGLPPSITAATGYDALVHCMEAYANVHAHPIVDVIALEGIRRIGLNLEKAVSDGSDLNARTEVMLGALYGGLCLGPVNTAAVHALAYPLGGAFHVAHGVSNSLLTPHVFRFNLPAAVDRYADIARMLGVERGLSDEATGQRGVERLTELSINCGIPQHLRDFDVPEEALSVMARDSMKVTRLLQNNPRPVTEEDALEIYRSAW
jgi:alcohol dehydrogenase class IV